MKLLSSKIEQGASKKRIGQYLRRWLGWSLIGAAFIGPAIAAEQAADNLCSVNDAGDYSFVTYPDGTAGRVYDGELIGLRSLNLTAPPRPYGICETLTAPASSDLRICGPTFTIPTGTFYAQLFDVFSDTYCSYEITLTPTTASAKIVPLLTSIDECEPNDINCIGAAIKSKQTPFCDSITETEYGNFNIPTPFGPIIETVNDGQSSDLDGLIRNICFPVPG